MNELLKKLNYKNQAEIVILNYPETFHSEVEKMQGFTKIKNDLRGVGKICFALIFLTKKKEIEQVYKRISKLLEQDAVLWFAYPKSSSKKYKCDFNRDTGWDILGQNGYEGVRMIAIDEDWSALRFRKAENIKNMKRRKSMAISKTGKRKTEGN